MNEKEFLDALKELNIYLTNDQLDKLNKFYSLLIEWNTKINLTRIVDKESIYLKHFYDSLTITKINDFSKVNSLVDVGTGAGFPGIVIKIFFPHIKVVLIDSNNKKVTFLTNLIKKLDLEDIIAVNTRSEEYAHQHLDSFDVVTARAVTTLPALIELCLPLVKVGGYFIPLKGNVSEELEISRDILTKLNGTLEEKKEFNLPYEKSIRNILKIKKTDVTPKGYPRTYDKIKKSLKKNSK